MFVFNCYASHTKCRTYFMFVCVLDICLIMISHFISMLQLTVLNKEIWDGQGSSKNKICNFQFRVKENSVEYFYPGSRS
jgi:hypothetical protein